MQVIGVLGQGLVDPATPAVFADDLGFTRGDGCFEGCRVVDGAIDKIELHVARMHRSAAALGITFDEPAWLALIDEVVAAWPAGVEGSMRWFLTRGRAGAPEPTGIVSIAELPAPFGPQRRDGIRAVTLSRGTAYDAFGDADWLLGGVKTISYAVNMAAQREAVRRGADDVIFVSADGQVLEAPTSSVVWTVGNSMYTIPPGANGILESTTQLRLFERAAEQGWQTAHTAAVVDDLHAADTVFLAGTVRGPVDVIELDGREHARDVDLVRTIQKLAGF
ncbi:MAG TPA: aminotransferase class IV [Jatrophihabitantaceae bacterium]|jgi:4-amino-4-deoxychorismate lyase